MVLHDLECSKCGKTQKSAIIRNPSRLPRCPKPCNGKTQILWSGVSTTVGFREIVLYINSKTGLPYTPGHADEPSPGPDYRRVSITSMHQYEKVRNGINATEREKTRILHEIEREYFDTKAKESREATRLKMEEAIRKGGHWVQETDEKGIVRTRWAPITARARAFFDAACKLSDKRREAIRRKAQGDPNFHSRVLEHRASERSVVDGAAKRPQLPNLRELMERLRR